MKIPISKIVTILLSVTFTYTYTAIPTIVHAEIYGSATDEFFQNKELVKSWSDICEYYNTAGTQNNVYLSYSGDETNWNIYLVTSRDRYLSFKLREDIEFQEALPQIYEIIEPYYPNLKDCSMENDGVVMSSFPKDRNESKYATYLFSGSDNGYFSIEDYRAEFPSKETGDIIRQELAAKGLISEFYNFGDTAEYVTLKCPYQNMLTYSTVGTRINTVKDEPIMFQEETIDRSVLEEFFADHIKGGMNFLREKYAKFPWLDPFGMLALDDAAQEYYQLTGTNSDGETIQFYKVVRDNHTQYYTDNEYYYSNAPTYNPYYQNSIIGKYLMQMPEDNELYVLHDFENQTVLPRWIRHTSDVLWEHNETDTYDVDVDTVRSYLDEHHPGYKIEYASISGSSGTYFEVIPSEELTFREQMDLYAELYHALGISHGFSSLENSSGIVQGKNEMEQPCDTNLDCDINILDVIAANKYILGIKKLDETGIKNADMNNNGMLDSDDSLSILKVILT